MLYIQNQFINRTPQNLSNFVDPFHASKGRPQIVNTNSQIDQTKYLVIYLCALITSILFFSRQIEIINKALKTSICKQLSKYTPESEKETH